MLKYFKIHPYFVTKAEAKNDVNNFENDPMLDFGIFPNEYNGVAQLVNASHLVYDTPVDLANTIAILRIKTLIKTICIRIGHKTSDRCDDEELGLFIYTIALDDFINGLQSI